MGHSQPDNRRRNRHDETGDGAGNPNVKERPSRRYWRFYADISAQRANANNRQKRNKERQGGVDPVTAAGGVMAEFVCPQDQQESDGKGRAANYGGSVGQLFD